jgi:pimeloyl-ACP methyl ester carboxylesterase
MSFVTSDGCKLYYEDRGHGVPILLIHPSGASAATWGDPFIDELTRIGRVIAYDRRGYARSGGEPPRSMSPHTADAAAILDSVGTTPAVVVGMSSGAAITVDLAVRRPDLVRTAIAHEFPWRLTRHLPTPTQVVAFAKMAGSVLRGRPENAADVLLRGAYAYRDGGSAWDAFPEEWRRIGKESAPATLRDFLNSIGDHPTAAELATITVPVVCTTGTRSPEFMGRLVRILASAIPGARTEVIEGTAHAAPFDAPAAFAQLIADALVRR